MLILAILHLSMKSRFKRWGLGSTSEWEESPTFVSIFNLSHLSTYLWLLPLLKKILFTHIPRTVIENKPNQTKQNQHSSGVTELQKTGRVMTCRVATCSAFLCPASSTVLDAWKVTNQYSCIGWLKFAVMCSCVSEFQPMLKSMLNSLNLLGKVPGESYCKIYSLLSRQREHSIREIF